MSIQSIVWPHPSPNTNNDLFLSLSQKKKKEKCHLFLIACHKMTHASFLWVSVHIDRELFYDVMKQRERCEFAATLSSPPYRHPRSMIFLEPV